MEFKEGDRVHVTRINTNEVDFYATLKDSKNGNDGNPFILSECSDGRFECCSVFKSNTEGYGLNAYDYYTLAEDEEDKEEPEVQFSEEMWRQAGKNIKSFVNGFNNKCDSEQHTEPSDKGVIIAQSIIDNRDGDSFTSAHDMIIWLNQIEEMHGENISVKGWSLIFDCVKTSIAPVFFGEELKQEETKCRQ